LVQGGTIIVATTEPTDGPSEDDSTPSDVTLTVRDNGVGMSFEVRKRAFEPFFTTKPAERGSGLGLATVHAIAERAGGEVTIESTVNAGTTVSVRLPGATSRAVPRQTEQEPALGTGELVLLAEDNVHLRRTTRLMLELAGYRVIEAESGDEALRVFNDDVTILVTDVVMPGMSGIELTERVLARRPDVRVVYISGHPRDVLPDDFDEAILAKPFSENDLLRAVSGEGDSPGGR
jgi:CheY-like chemotaxis protein